MKMIFFIENMVKDWWEAYTYDWFVVRITASFLKTNYDPTNKISGTSYVIEIFSFMRYSVHSTLNPWTYDFANDRYDMGLLEHFNKFMFISLVLDLRHKLQLVLYILNDMYREEIGGKIRKSLEKIMYKMSNEYNSRLGLNNDAVEDKSLENIDLGNSLLRLRLWFVKDNGMLSHGGSSNLDEYLGEKSETFRDADDFDILR